MSTRGRAWPMANPNRVSIPNRVIIVRHAHREVASRLDDNGLSPKGWRQAHEFALWFTTQYPNTVPTILTSPRQRCQDTVDPVVRLVNQSGGHSSDQAIAQIERGLDEQLPDETADVFIARITRALAAIRLAGITRSPVIVCSHGDWIPSAIDVGWKKSVNLGKGEWIELDWNT